jgi:hypothetical protein
MILPSQFAYFALAPAQLFEPHRILREGAAEELKRVTRVFR